MIAISSMCRGVAVAALLLVSPVVHAAGDLSRQEPIEVTIELGKPGQHAFAPNKLRFETGKLYKLVLRNPSNDPHYFTSHAFTQLIYTRKVQVVQDRDGKSDACRVQGRHPRDRSVSRAHRRMVVRTRCCWSRDGSPVWHRRRRRQEPRRARNGGRNRDRVTGQTEFLRMAMKSPRPWPGASVASE
jgi:hypothetical protein